ncbi:HIT domain-containing protein [Lederbergia sp. NSJ-179]|uniref:HIT family protein n=1 Tax=Lederbergia sp. NSJ-179 TaxID=2931402 RepID=UPI001FD2066B|nr:HIT domain-containing protein [Lederbergia sp. NSJ-179]MCJ7843597.1 HIT domain-containing protein [Lederbergia sp. NSJ-179]
MKDCIFCKIAKGEAKSWKVYEDEHAYAFLDINPVSKYHTLIIPKKHYENIFDITEEELLKVISVVKKVVSLYNNKLGIKNVQIVNSSGAEAQQDVFHFHVHVVPRTLGDNQNIKWTTHKEWRETFDDLLAKI